MGGTENTYLIKFNFGKREKKWINQILLVKWVEFACEIQHLTSAPRIMSHIYKDEYIQRLYTQSSSSYS